MHRRKRIERLILAAGTFTIFLLIWILVPSAIDVFFMPPFLTVLLGVTLWDLFFLLRRKS